MFKNGPGSLSVTTVLGLSLVSVATGLSFCQQKDIYKIVSKQDTSIFQETGAKQFLLYKNDQVYQADNVVWTINNKDTSKSIRIDQNGKLTWKKYCFEYAISDCGNKRK